VPALVCFVLLNKLLSKQASMRIVTVAKESVSSVALWIARINAGARECGLSYSRFIDGLKKANIEMDRRVLADLAMNEKIAFAALAEQAKQALGQANA